MHWLIGCPSIFNFPAVLIIFYILQSPPFQFPYFVQWQPVRGPQECRGYYRWRASKTRGEVQSINSTRQSINSTGQSINSTGQSSNSTGQGTRVFQWCTHMHMFKHTDSDTCTDVIFSGITRLYSSLHWIAWFKAPEHCTYYCTVCHSICFVVIMHLPVCWTLWHHNTCRLLGSTT